MNEIIIYQSPDNQTQVEVQFEGETFWLSQEQIALLFERERSVITKHLRNIFNEGELDEQVVCANFAHTTKHGAIEGKTQEKYIKYYNLDAIISVGYRVNSKRGTQFRQWATQRLKEYLVRGYAINQKRLEELGKMVQLIEKSGQTENLHLPEAKGLLDILSHYAKSFVLLNQYDSHTIKTAELSTEITCEIQYEEAKAAIAKLKKQLITQRKPPNCLPMKKTRVLKVPYSIVQTFGGQYLYSSIEEQAAN